MKTITPVVVMKDYNKLKKLADTLFFLKLYSLAMYVIDNAARLMYGFNIIYVDDELETMLTRISKKLNKKNEPLAKMNNDKTKIIFYDYFSIDNRGLTEQYLQGLYR
jgi:hypothetical protein